MNKKTLSDFSFSHYQAEYISDHHQQHLDDIGNRLNMLMLITDDAIGDRNVALATSLKVGLIKAIADKEPYPSAIVFMNRGVFLALDNSNCLNELRALEAKGVMILSNCTCLDYYRVMDRLAVGGITNLYHIAEMIKLTKNTIEL